MEHSQVLIRPVVSEKSYVLSAAGKYTFRVHPDAHRTQIRQAVEALFEVHVVEVRTLSVKSKPKRRGITRGRSRAWGDGPEKRALSIHHADHRDGPTARNAARAAHRHVLDRVLGGGRSIGAVDGSKPR